MGKREGPQKIIPLEQGLKRETCAVLPLYGYVPQKIIPLEQGLKQCTDLLLAPL